MPEPDPVLRNLKEPALLGLEQDQTAFALRFLILPTRANKVALRVVKDGNHHVLHARRRGAYGTTKAIESRDETLTPEESRTFDELLRRMKFFEMPDRDSVQGFDGVTWVLEGVHNGRYHSIERWCPHKLTGKRGLEHMMQLFRLLFSKAQFPPLNEWWLKDVLAKLPR